MPTKPKFIGSFPTHAGQGCTRCSSEVRHHNQVAEERRDGETMNSAQKVRVLVLSCSAFGQLAYVSHGNLHRAWSARAEFERNHPCPSTGKKVGACPEYIADHIVALCKGGPDTAANFQWQTIKDAKKKDRVECK